MLRCRIWAGQHMDALVWADPGDYVVAAVAKVDAPIRTGGYAVGIAERHLTRRLTLGDERPFDTCKRLERQAG